MPGVPLGRPVTVLRASCEASQARSFQARQAVEAVTAPWCGQCVTAQCPCVTTSLPRGASTGACGGPRQGGHTHARSHSDTLAHAHTAHAMPLMHAHSHRHAHLSLHTYSCTLTHLMHILMYTHTHAKLGNSTRASTFAPSHMHSHRTRNTLMQAHTQCTHVSTHTYKRPAHRKPCTPSHVHSARSDAHQPHVCKGRKRHVRLTALALSLITPPSGSSARQADLPAPCSQGDSGGRIGVETHVI